MGKKILGLGRNCIELFSMSDAIGEKNIAESKVYRSIIDNNFFVMTVGSLLRFSGFNTCSKIMLSNKSNYSKIVDLFKTEILLDSKDNINDILILFLFNSGQEDFVLANLMAFADLFDYNFCVRGLLFVKIFSIMYYSSDSIKKYFIAKKDFITYCFSNLFNLRYKYKHYKYNKKSYDYDFAVKAKGLILLSLVTGSLLSSHFLLDNYKNSIVSGRHIEHGKKIIEAVGEAQSDDFTINLGYKDYDKMLEFLCVGGFIDELFLSDI